MQKPVTWKMAGTIFFVSFILLIGLCCGWYVLWSRSMNAIINGPRDIAGPNLKSNLVVYFRRDTRPEQIMDFHHTVIGIPGRTPDETFFLPGMAGVLAISSSEGHEGVAIDFVGTATPEERANVRSRIEASPIVVRVFENAIPNEIRNIEKP